MSAAGSGRQPRARGRSPVERVDWRRESEPRQTLCDGRRNDLSPWRDENPEKTFWCASKAGPGGRRTTSPGLRAKSTREGRETMQALDAGVDIVVAGITPACRTSVLPGRALRQMPAGLCALPDDRERAAPRPRRCEIGTHQGGSALYLADLLQLLGGGVGHHHRYRRPTGSPRAGKPEHSPSGGSWGAARNLAAGFKQVLVIEVRTPMPTRSAS